MNFLALARRSLRPAHLGFMRVARAPVSITRSRISLKTHIALPRRRSFSNQGAGTGSQTGESAFHATSARLENEKHTEKSHSREGFIVGFLLACFFFAFSIMIGGSGIMTDASERERRKKDLNTRLQEIPATAYMLHIMSDPDATAHVDGLLDLITTLTHEPEKLWFSKAQLLMTKLHGVIELLWEEPLSLSTRKKWVAIEPHFQDTLERVKVVVSEVLQRNHKLRDKLEVMYSQLEARAVEKGGWEPLLKETEGGPKLVKLVAGLLIAGQERNKDYQEVLAEMERFLWHKIRDDYKLSKSLGAKRSVQERGAEEFNANGSSAEKTSSERPNTQQENPENAAEENVAEARIVTETSVGGDNGEEKDAEENTLPWNSTLARKYGIQEGTTTPIQSTQTKITGVDSPPEEIAPEKSPPDESAPETTPLEKTTPKTAAEVRSGKAERGSCAVM